MEWHEEVENLNMGKFLKLESGRHKIKFLEDGEMRDSQIGNKQVRQLCVKVSYNGNEYVWTITKGETINSLYGQIALIGRIDGTIKDKEVSIIVKGEGMNKDYTVEEALDLITKETQRRKA